MIETNDPLTTLNAIVERGVSAQLDRHANAGKAISRDQARGRVIAQNQEKLVQLAERWETEGKEESADVARDIANLLPNLRQR